MEAGATLGTDERSGQPPGSPPPDSPPPDSPPPGSPLSRIAASAGPASPLRAAAGVLLAVAVGALQVRMGDEWNAGIFFVIAALAGALVLSWGLAAAEGEGRPDGAATALLIAGFFLVASAVLQLADALGGEGGGGSLTWTFLLIAAVAAYPGWVLDSPVMALLSSLALGVAFVAGVDWIFGIEDVDTFRWLFLLLIVAYAAVGVSLEQTRERHAVQHISAAGIATLALGFTLFAGLVEQAVAAAFGAGGAVGFNGPAGWELVLLVAAVGLVAYAVLRREPGPGFLGTVGLGLFISEAALPADETSLVGWPLLLLLAALGAVAAVVATEGR